MRPYWRNPELNVNLDVAFEELEVQLDGLLAEKS